jgi:hypothetical protein
MPCCAGTPALPCARCASGRDVCSSPVRPFDRAGWRKVYAQFCDAFSACPWVLQHTLAAFPSILPVRARAARCCALLRPSRTASGDANGLHERDARPRARWGAPPRETAQSTHSCGYASSTAPHARRRTSGPAAVSRRGQLLSGARALRMSARLGCVPHKGRLLCDDVWARRVDHVGRQRLWPAQLRGLPAGPVQSKHQPGGPAFSSRALPPPPPLT